MVGRQRRRWGGSVGVSGCVRRAARRAARNFVRADLVITKWGVGAEETTARHLPGIVGGLKSCLAEKCPRGMPAGACALGRVSLTVWLPLELHASKIRRL